mgnify:CR=1 FL=1
MNTINEKPALKAFDLTKRAPRSPRVKLGGYTWLARLLDKARADIAGKVGEYHTNCPMDQMWLQFVGVDYNEIRGELEEGAGDTEILEWVAANAKTHRQSWEIDAWNAETEKAAPVPGTEMMDYLVSTRNIYSERRSDVVNWFELIDLEDYGSFSGNV